MNTTQNIILDFSHIYPEEIESQVKGLRRVDSSDIEGTDMYCTKDAEEEIRRRLSAYSPHGIHFLDNGNYHYVTKLFAEKITYPFSLVLYDHHSDMQTPLFPDMTSCGNWAAELLRKDRFLKQMVLVGPEQKSIEEIPPEFKGKLVCISMEEVDKHAVNRKLSEIKMDLPVYISIDKDVLNRDGARTNWNQGDMPLRILERLLLEVFEHQDVIGVDICGECSPLEPLQELLKDEKINKMTNDALYSFLSDLFRFFDENVKKNGLEKELGEVYDR